MVHKKLTTSQMHCPISARFIAELRDKGKNIITLDEAAVVYGKSKQLTSRFIRSLIQQGVLISLVPGKYIFQTKGAESNAPADWPIIAQELASLHANLISHHSAMWLHGMTTQQLSDVYITVPSRIRNKKIKGILYNFVLSQKPNSWGVTTLITPNQEKLSVTDIERTILDGLERPELSGGIKNVIYGIWAAKNKINWERLMAYSADFQTMAAIKRLGYVLELLSLAPQYRPILSKITAPSECYISLDPSAAKVGRCLIRWHIRVNVNTEEVMHVLSPSSEKGAAAKREKAIS
jgi:predicted transcriptional regulator of viral defense system